MCVLGTDNSKQARSETRYKVFASTSADDGVMCTRDGRPVVSSHHQAHLNELAGIAWQPKQKHTRADPTGGKVK